MDRQLVPRIRMVRIIRLISILRHVNPSRVLRHHPDFFRIAFLLAIHQRGAHDATFLTKAVDATFPLAEATAAHTALESGAHVGKIVLIP